MSFSFWKNYKNIFDSSISFFFKKETHCFSSFFKHFSCKFVFHARSSKSTSLFFFVVNSFLKISCFFCLDLFVSIQKKKHLKIFHSLNFFLICFFLCPLFMSALHVDIILISFFSQCIFAFVLSMFLLPMFIDSLLCFFCLFFLRNFFESPLFFLFFLKKKNFFFICSSLFVKLFLFDLLFCFTPFLVCFFSILCFQTR